MKLRGYQRELVDGALKLWAADVRRIAMVMATGGGKTPTAMTIAEMSVAAGSPVLWLAHRTELIDQAIDKARQVAPGRRIGRLQGKIKQYKAEIVVGSVQTASTKSTLPLLCTRTWGLIIIDETHHVTADTYMRILRELRAYESDGPLVLGVTATLDRSDGRALGEVFEDIVDPQIGLVDLIRHPDGPFLVPPRGIRVKIEGLDLGRVKRVAGDYNSGALGAAMSAAMAPQKIVEAWQEHAKGRPTVAFLPTVAISIEQAAAFRAAGYRAMHLDGETPTGDRRDALDAFRRGEIDILTNVGLFTEGTDLPSIACVILGRPTSSTSLYQQMVGRGLRLHPGKMNCVVLDVTGVTGKHTLATLKSLNGAPSPDDMPDDLLMYDDELDDPLDTEAAEVEREQGGEPEPIEYADGELAHELVDLFGESHSAWLRTPGGVWFISAGSAGFLYLRPRPDAPDRYDLCGVAEQDRGPRREPVYHLLRPDMEIGYAMAAGDELVEANPIWQAGKDASWRRDYRRVTQFERKAMERAARLLDAAP